MLCMNTTHVDFSLAVHNMACGLGAVGGAKGHVAMSSGNMQKVKFSMFRVTAHQHFNAMLGCIISLWH